jgi:hypothetical protein
VHLIITVDRVFAVFIAIALAIDLLRLPRTQSLAYISLSWGVFSLIVRIVVNSPLPLVVGILLLFAGIGLLYADEDETSQSQDAVAPSEKKNCE